tara:strand:+ start:1860 stop:2222 length:363 start_codon:yes stop_codon:yes gene_type:complete
MHYLDSNTDLNNPITLYVNTRIDSGVLVDVELYSENENKLIYTDSGLNLAEGGYFQEITIPFQDNLVDKKTYTILLKSGGINVYQSKIYIDSTKDFTLDTTVMTTGSYQTNNTNNEFTII